MKFIIIDGPDDAGKTTLVGKLLRWYPKFKEIKFERRNNDNTKFRIQSANEFQIVEKLLPHLNSNYTYVLDRFYLSNMVYDKALNRAPDGQSERFREWFLDTFKVLEIILTRNKISEDFEDDQVSATNEQFNTIIDLYENLNCPTFKVHTNKVTNSEEISALLSLIDKFI